MITIFKFLWQETNRKTKISFNQKEKEEKKLFQNEEEEKKKLCGIEALNI